MLKRAAICSLAVAWALSCATAGTAQTVDDARSSLAKLQKWLGRGPNAKAWNEYLRTDQLNAELAKGDQADEVVVYGVLARYSSGQPGLESRPVARVRNALAAWHTKLEPLPESRLPELANAAKTNLTAASEVDVATARNNLASELKRLDAHLKSSPDGPAWREALAWDALMAQFEPGATPDAAVLVAAYRELTTDKPGLEHRSFRLARRALRRYIELSTYATGEKSDETTAAVLVGVAEDIDGYVKEHDGERARRLGRALGYLRRHDQAEQLVAAARRHYCQPNVIVEVSREFLAAGFEQDVDQTSPVRQMILGTDVYGTGRTIGKTHFRFLPEQQRAAFETRLVGDTHTDTIGYNGPVRIYSTGVTHIRATKRLAFDANGLTAEPASTEAVVDNTINAIAANRCGPIGKFIERMAWKKAGQQSHLAELIAADRAEEQVNREVDQQAVARLSEANERFRRHFRDPLLRRDQLPIVNASTSEQALHLEVLQVDQDQLAAPSPPPVIDGQPMLAVRLHESAAGNFAAALLAGETLDQARIEKMFTEFEQPVPEELKPKTDEPAWSMTFSRTDPITVDLRDGGFRVTLRGQQFTSGDRTFAAMDISAAYKIERTENGVKLLRQGDLVISPPGHQPGQPLSAGQISLRRLLTRRFEELFKPEIVTEGLKLKGEFAELGTLTLSQLSCENGWATLGWNAK
ncbi:MAG: hypothetical protein WD875_09295 [Pirellulales bacterium]